MNLPSIVYRHYLSSKGIRKRGWQYLRKLLIVLLHDPACTLRINDRPLTFPLSHSLAENISRFRFFDHLPGRIGAYIHETDGYLNCIDVGANIGGTIAFFTQSDSDSFLAIEPSPKFNRYLHLNWGSRENVTIVSAICSSSSDTSTVEFVERRGTSSVRQAETGIAVNKRTLDEIASEYRDSAAVNVVKIDTDGYDFAVLAGARDLISANQPVILYECDVFNNARYVEDCLDTLEHLKTLGYDSFLLYDNFGYLMGRYAFSDLSPFKKLLFYQLTSDFYYFDILVMKDKYIHEFYKREIEFFATAIPNASLKQTALAAAELTA